MSILCVQLVLLPPAEQKVNQCSFNDGFIVPTGHNTLFLFLFIYFFKF